MSVALDNIEFFYPNSPEKTILNIKQWAVPANEKCFVYGPSGCGKSTLLNIISGVLTPSKGSVTVLGEPLEKMSTRQRNQFRANNIGYVFQQFNLILYLHAIDNVRLAHHFASKNQRINTYQLNAKIADLLIRLNINEEHWYKPVHQLSIGQQQRVAIARALINSPQLVIADEPTSSLDANNRENFISLLMNLCSTENITLLFVSHDQQLSQHFTQTAALPEINILADKQ